MNFIMSINRCFSGESDQHSSKPYTELEAFGQKAPILKRAFKSQAKMLPNFDSDMFSQKDVRILCER
jgi:hypothetical protein